MQNSSIRSKTIVAVVAVLMAGVGVLSNLYAKSVKNPESSTLATPPVYGQTGILVTQSDSVGSLASYTDAEGHTSSVYCNSTESTVDCHEGSGLHVFLALPDGSHIQLPDDMSIAYDLDHKDDIGYPSFIPGPLSEALMTAIHGKAQPITFRWRTAPFSIMVAPPPGGWNYIYLCMPLTVNLGGQDREKFAKHHSMEACYRICPDDKRWQDFSKATWHGSGDTLKKEGVR